MKIPELSDICAAPLEIERKFLIAYPDLDEIRAMPNYRKRRIDQTYLSADENFPGGRIRRIEENGEIRFVYTFKQKISDLTRREFEKEISEEEYRALQNRKKEGTFTIRKTRHVFSFENLIYELDVYDFWQNVATLEAEVDSEEREIPIPPCVQVIKEVTFDRRFLNSQLAESRGAIPGLMDENERGEEDEGD